MKIVKYKTSFPYILFSIFLLIEVIVALTNKFVSINGSGKGFHFYKSILSQPWIWISLFISSIQFIIWTKILSKSELSLAYSMTSLSYPLTMLAAAFIFKENLPVLVWVGGLTITLGTMLLGSESNSN